MSLHPENIEPSEGTLYLTYSLAWLGRGWLIPQGGAQAPSFLCADKTFSCYRLPPLHCPALSPASASPLPLGCPLTLWLIPNSSMSCGQAGEFCCSQMLLFTQMNFSWFPTRACEWVAWAFSFLFCLEIRGLTVLQD